MMHPCKMVRMHSLPRLDTVAILNMMSQGFMEAGSTHNKNALRDGLGANPIVDSSHPVEGMQKNFLRHKLDAKDAELSALYGSHMMMRRKMEEALLSRHQRLPGLKSEFVGLSTLLNMDEDFGFEDCLDDPWLRETPTMALHDAMEMKLKM